MEQRHERRHQAARNAAGPKRIRLARRSRLSGPEGILFDFNYGCRVQVPVDGWLVRMTDLDTLNVLFDETVEANTW